MVSIRNANNTSSCEGGTGKHRCAMTQKLHNANPEYKSSSQCEALGSKDPSDGHCQGSGFEKGIESPVSNLPLLNYMFESDCAEVPSNRLWDLHCRSTHEFNLCEALCQAGSTLPDLQGECVYAQPCPIVTEIICICK